MIYLAGMIVVVVVIVMSISAFVKGRGCKW